MTAGVERSQQSSVTIQPKFQADNSEIIIQIDRGADGQKEYHTLKGRKSEQAAPSRNRQEAINPSRESQPMALTANGTAAVPVSHTETVPAKVREAKSAEQHQQEQP